MTQDVSTAVGRTTSDQAHLAPGPADRLTAALDFDDPPFAAGAPLPNAWHWMYFLSAPKASTVGADGRGAAGDLIPHFEGLNRMWAGGAFTFGQPLLIDETVSRQSTITSITPKDGKSGRLVLASVVHQLATPSGGALTERQDIVFRERKPQSAALPDGERTTAKAQWSRTFKPDEVLLFRFSALTYNSHRIHYDQPYTTQTEGYPGLIVHGPLTAILLLDSIRRNVPQGLRTFEYRAIRPLFCGNPVTLNGTTSADGKSVEVWAEDSLGFVAMRGTGILL